MKSTFKILSAINFNMLADDIQNHLNDGFELIDEPKYLNGWYVQYMKKEDWRIDEKCACDTLQMRRLCAAFDNCILRKMCDKDITENNCDNVSTEVNDG